MSLNVRAYAKINLFLDITGTLPNGYHSLFTVMRQIDLYDELEISVSSGSGISVSCDEPKVPCNEKNIAYRAALKFLNETGKSAAVNIAIKKIIPLEAGLGGSSTDGAAVLTALNGAFGEPFTVSRLMEIGAELGADVPFCIHGKTALCTGIGEQVTPLDCPADHVIALIKPDFSCNTGEAYRRYDASPVPPSKDGERFVKRLSGGVSGWSGGVYNVFEALYNDPRISEITGSLRESGALAAALTGSGSAVFGVFVNENAAEKALKKIDAPYKKAVKPL